MASTEIEYSGSIRGIGRLLHRKKVPESGHPLIHPSTADYVGPTNSKKKNHHRGFPFRGLGCSSSSSASPKALVPAESAAASAVRSAAEWHGKSTPGKRRGRKTKKATARKGGVHSPPADVADVGDLWCAPGVVFGADASVDCAVAQRRERLHRERVCNTRRGIEEEMVSSILDCPFTMDMRHFRSGLLHSGHLRYARQRGCGRSPAEFDDEMMMFQTRVFLGGVDVHDQYKDLRLDVDNMSYEELLELSERIGYVNTGLREEEIIRSLSKPKHSFSSALPSEKEWKCIICQEEYIGGNDVGRLECGHCYHTCCIKQWLLRKNACPVCKTAVTKS